MVVLVVEAMAVPTVAILMGTVTIKAITLPATLELETILQPIPTGMIILGLELKSKFARRLPVLKSPDYEAFVFSLYLYFILNALT